MEEFLRTKRQVSEDIIKKLMEEKIDSETVTLMTDAELSAYIPKHGDRMALMQFCRTEQTSDDEISSVVQRLQEKTSQRKRKGYGGKREKKKDFTSTSYGYSRMAGNQNAKKRLRAYQLCWHHFDGKAYRQVQERKGGGVKYLKGSTDITVSEMEKVAKEMFFPHGVTKRGSSIEYFDITMRDPTDIEIPSATTLQDLYVSTASRVVRLYMCTTFVPGFTYTALHDPLASLTADESDIPSMTTTKRARRSRIRTKLKLKPSEGLTESDDSVTNSSEVNPRESATTCKHTLLAMGIETNTKDNTKARAVCSNMSNEVTGMEDLNSNLNRDAFDLGASTSPGESATTCEHTLLGIETNTNNNTKAGVDNFNVVTGMEDLNSDLNLDAFDLGASTSSGALSSHMGKYVDELIAQTLSAENTSQALSADNTSQTLSADDTVQFGKFLEQNAGTLSRALMLTSTPTKSTDHLKLHRGHVFSELNEAVRKDLLSITEMGTHTHVQMILPNGKEERGDDSGGVLRDALSEYWTTFYKKCTTGTKVKVPAIRHDMREVWEEVAKILVFGLNSVGYFPIAIAKPFLNSCFGLPTKDEEIVSHFMEMIPAYEKELIEKKPEDIDFNSDEMLDFLEAHDVKALVSVNNWQRVLIEIAHKEMIQEPAYVSDCWRKILQVYARLPLGGLDELVTSLTPKATKVISSLLFDQNLNTVDKACEKYLKRFIRMSSEGRLRKFLRFCTGSDIMVCESIHVRLVTPENDFGRTPVAHTCGCVLELPNTYSSPQEMEEEFGELLDSNIWIMDIV